MDLAPVELMSCCAEEPLRGFATGSVFEKKIL
jgi:hypothetical protein